VRDEHTFCLSSVLISCPLKDFSVEIKSISPVNVTPLQSLASVLDDTFDGLDVF
jgi:hypothetical protein